MDRDSLASRLAAACARPVLVDSRHARSFVHGLSAAVGEETELRRRLADGDDGFWTVAGAQLYRPYEVSDGILRIPVQGALYDKGTITTRMFTGYEYLRRAYMRGMDDPGVRGILLHVDSPGGEAAGNFELADAMRARAGEKPVVAVADGLALSGAYSLATVAQRLYVRPSGYVGSVGVVLVHMEVSRMLDDIGMTVTVIRSGEQKARANSFEPLTAEAQADLQRDSDRIYQSFVSLVSRNRMISEQAVRNTEARVYSAADGIEVGLADQIGEIHSLPDDWAGGQNRGISMSESVNATETEGAEASAMTVKAQAADPDIQARIDEAVGQALAAERKRRADVVGGEQYAGREALAENLLNLGLPADQINSALAAAPKPEAPKPESQHQAPRSHFAEAMDRREQPEVGQEDAALGDPNDGIVTQGPWTGKSAASAALLESYRKAGGSLKQNERAN